MNQTRKKSSLGIYDPFSKFTFTSDVDLSVRQAMSDLDGWLARADSGLVDDLEKLPYVCAAMEQLEQRKKYWNEHRATDSNKASLNTICKMESDRVTSSHSKANGNEHSFGGRTLSFGVDEQDKSLYSSKTNLSNEESGLDQSAVIVESLEAEATILSSSNEESKNLQEFLGGTNYAKENDSYNFYQALESQAHLHLPMLYLEQRLLKIGKHLR